MRNAALLLYGSAKPDELQFPSISVPTQRIYVVTDRWLGHMVQGGSPGAQISKTNLCLRYVASKKL